MIMPAATDQVIAYDIDGKQLRVGDAVVVVRAFDRSLVGLRCKIIGRCPANHWCVQTDIPFPGSKYKYCSSVPHMLRRIDGQDSASWDQVRESTGWKPSREKVLEVVEQ